VFRLLGSCVLLHSFAAATALRTMPCADALENMAMRGAFNNSTAPPTPLWLRLQQQ
jgi:hypothetical protein